MICRRKRQPNTANIPSETRQCATCGAGPCQFPPIDEMIEDQMDNDRIASEAAQEYRDELMIYTENIYGNMHTSALWINKRSWAKYLLQMDYIGGTSTVAVFRMPRWLVHEIRSKSNYALPIDHDDPVT